MKERQATSVVTRYSTEGSGVVTHSGFEYVVGSKCIVPSGKKVAMITEIKVVDDWRPHVEVFFEDWGSLWLTDYIIQIRFKNEQHREIRNAEQAVEELENPGGKQESSD